MVFMKKHPDSGFRRLEGIVKVLERTGHLTEPASRAFRVIDFYLYHSNPPSSSKPSSSSFSGVEMPFSFHPLNR